MPCRAVAADLAADLASAAVDLVVAADPEVAADLVVVAAAVDPGVAVEGGKADRARSFHLLDRRP